MKNMKKYIIWMMVLSGVFVTGCTNLDETVYDKVLAADFGTTDKQISAIIAPIYTKLQNTFPYDLWQIEECSSDMTVIPTRKGGDWWDGGQFKYLRLHSWTASTSAIGNAYNNCMAGISTCNQIYYTIENSEADIENREQVLAEIRGVRAFWYYKLIDNWGNVPIVTDFTDTSNPTTSTRAEVYAFIMSELNDIKDVVRSDVSSSSYGKMNKGVVYTLLAKMYLNALIWNPDGGEQWQKCADACDTIMSLGYELESDRSVNFQVNNESSGEIIFPAIFTTSDGNNGIAYMTLHYLDPEALGLNLSPWNGVCAMPGFIQSFDSADKRKAASFLTGAMLDPDTGDTITTAHGRPLVHYETVTMKYSIDNDGWGYVEQEDGGRCSKWEFESGLTGAMENDFAIFRLADVYLMKAEALVRMGTDNSEATSLVNAIRTRAFDDASKLKTSVTLDDIYQERRFELAWESMGRQDQIRFGTFLNEISGWKKAETSEVSLLFPIPQTALDANPLLEQNTGY
jgi:starch-binding outer membrane protein, SusD/RagB family